MHKPHLLNSNEMYEYLLASSVRESAIQKKLREKTIAQIEQSEMMIAPEQGQFLAFLVRLMHARHAIEVGVFTGYGSLSIAQALPADGQLIACDIDGNWPSLGQPFWQEAKVDHKIQLRIAPALATLQKLLEAEGENKFDFVFIDADKINYPHYYELALRLVRVGGVIVIDNVLQIGKTRVFDRNSESARIVDEFNYFLLKDERVWLSMVPIGEGMTLALKK